MITISKEGLIRLQAALIDKYGGVHGIRDNALLESAMNAPFQSFDGHDLYPTKIAKITRLGYGLVKNHAFTDGNKRIGFFVMVTSFDANHIPFECEDEELRDEIRHVADGTVSYRDFLLWVCEHIDFI